MNLELDWDTCIRNQELKNNIPEMASVLKRLGGSSVSAYKRGWAALRACAEENEFVLYNVVEHQQKGEILTRILAKYAEQVLYTSGSKVACDHAHAAISHFIGVSSQMLTTDIRKAVGKNIRTKRPSNACNDVVPSINPILNRIQTLHGTKTA